MTRETFVTIAFLLMAVGATPLSFVIGLLASSFYVGLAFWITVMICTVIIASKVGRESP